MKFQSRRDRYYKDYRNRPKTFSTVHEDPDPSIMEPLRAGISVVASDRLCKDDERLVVTLSSRRVNLPRGCVAQITDALMAFVRRTGLRRGFQQYLNVVMQDSTGKTVSFGDTHAFCNAVGQLSDGTTIYRIAICSGEPEDIEWALRTTKYPR